VLLVPTTMKTACLAFLAAAASAMAQTIPTIPQDWSGIVANRIIINQGGIQNPDASVTCPAESPQCKVQTAFSAGQNYMDISGNRTAYYVGSQASVSDYNTGKVYLIDTASHTCQAYCPIAVPLEPIAIDPNATYQGQINYNGVQSDDWMWKVEIPIIKIVIQTSNFYVKAGTNTPLAEIDILAGAAVQNQTWVSFEAGRPDASYFQVNNASTCPLGNSQQCGGGSSSDNHKNNDPFNNDPFNNDHNSLEIEATESVARSALAGAVSRLGHANPGMILAMQGK
jgi:hypothetical protein